MDINTNEIDRMKHLMGYGLNEHKASMSNSVIEYEEVGADGKNYGILREGKKFYIKSAPSKNEKLVAEDYDYLGGVANRKSHEYTSYNVASKQFGLMMKGIRESVNRKAPEMKEFKPIENGEWQTEQTKEMRESIERFKQITENVEYIMAEDKKAYIANKQVPEAPKTNSDPKNAGGDPYTEKAEAKLDKDLKAEHTDPKTADDTYDENANAELDKDLKDTHEDPKTADDTYDEKPKYAPKNNIAESKKHVVKLTEAQALAWNKELNYMDTSKGTEIGSSEPYTDKVNEAEVDFADTVSGGDFENPEVVTDITIEPEDAAIEAAVAPETKEEVPFPEVEEPTFEEEVLPDENPSVVMDDEETFKESVKRSVGGALRKKQELKQVSEKIDRIVREILSEENLNVWGKHPAYQKQPMTVGNVSEPKSYGRDWNDASTKQDKPYGTEIGNGDPYTEKLINVLTDAVMNRLKDSEDKKKVN